MGKSCTSWLIPVEVEQKSITLRYQMTVCPEKQNLGYVLSICEERTFLTNFSPFEWFLDSLAQLEWTPLLSFNEKMASSSTEGLSKEEALRRERMRASLGLHTFTLQPRYVSPSHCCL